MLRENSPPTGSPIGKRPLSVVPEAMTLPLPLRPATPAGRTSSSVPDTKTVAMDEIASPRTLPGLTWPAAAGSSPFDPGCEAGVRDGVSAAGSDGVIVGVLLGVGVLVGVFVGP